jgi:hypothetical protein
MIRIIPFDVGNLKEFCELEKYFKEESEKMIIQKVILS